MVVDNQVCHVYGMPEWNKVLSDQIIPNGITPINTKNNTVANNTFTAFI
jgi:hypothetical protein